MIRTLWRKLGVAAFWLTYPALFFYLRIGTRTRVLIVVDDSILVVKGWLGLDKWQLPGGGVHHGEAAQNGALREVKEETGISLPANKLHFFYDGQMHEKGLTFRYHCFYVILPSRPLLNKQLIELTDIKWLPLSQVTAQNTTTETYRAVQTWLQR